MRTRFELILFFRIRPIRLHAILYQKFFEINEDMVQILLMLEILFTQESKVKDFSVVHHPALNQAFSSAIIF